MNDDATLLRLYVADRSEAAFTELVRRHIGLVHATAMRRVGGDAHLADDVTQTVFISLARKAPTLLDRTSLAGWLYLGTQLAAAAVVRGEQRRKARETTAHTMDLTNTPDRQAADLAQLGPLLDDALVTLKDDEREAIVLRFFQKQTFAEIGDALRVTEEAARKRVDRSLDKLHALLSRRGITSSVAALGVALTAAGVSTMPESLVARVTAGAVTQAAADAAVVTATGVAATLVPLAAAAAVALGAVALLSQRHANESLAAEIAQLGRQNEAIPALHADNERLVRAIAQADARPVAVAVVAAPAPGVPRVAPAPPPPPVRTRFMVTVTPEGVMQWEGQSMRLEEYLAKLDEFQGAESAGEAQLVIQANGARFPQMAWAIEEARKSGVRHLLIESDSQPDPRFKDARFWF
jgi:RNA polymerase sigma factor (sigma-70 family)